LAVIVGLLSCIALTGGTPGGIVIVMNRAGSKERDLETGVAAVRRIFVRTRAPVTCPASTYYNLRNG
jgi:hypothetical protein